MSGGTAPSLLATERSPGMAVTGQLSPIRRKLKGILMVNASQIQERMEVKGSDGQHVGTVDRIEGNRIKLTKSDSASGGQHHYIDMDMVDEIRDGAVCLSKSADEARRMWQ
jgi:hypothetical protein